MHYESIKAFENDTRAPQRGDTIQASCGKAVWFYKGGSRWDLLTETFLDLSPLQKFMGRRRYPHNGHITIQGDDDYYRCTRCHGRVGLEYRVEDRCSGVIGMYGMDYDFDWVPTAPTPEPEKSPQEKILDEFIRKREAKRVQPPEPAPWPGFDVPTSTERALDRAMRRLSFHEQDIHARLMPYRREEK